MCAVPGSTSCSLFRDHCPPMALFPGYHFDHESVAHQTFLYLYFVLGELRIFITVKLSYLSLWNEYSLNILLNWGSCWLQYYDRLCLNNVKLKNVKLIKN